MTTKPRFNKKEGYRFALLNRSQQDPVLQEGGSEQVLHPLDQRTADAMETGAFKPEGAINYQTDVSSEMRRVPATALGVKEIREVDENGFAMDGYDYNQHLSSAVEGGTFVGANGVEFSGRLQFEQQQAQLPSELFALEEMLPRRVDLEAILLAPELMDDDMKRQLEEEVNDDEALEEAEWADEFMGQLLGEEEDGYDEDTRPMTSKLVQGFDFDSHVSRLMRKPKAEMVENDFEGSDEDDFEGEEEEDDFEDDDEEYEDADAHFAAVLAEYERDNDGEGGGGEVEEGHLEQSDPIVLRALAIYHQSQEDDTSLGEVGLPPAREDILKFVRPETLLEEEVDITVPLEQPTLEGYMKAWASYQLTERSRFDCETIVSTRSTSDNLPSVITLPSKPSKSKPVMAAVREEEEEEDEDEMLNRMAARMRVAETAPAEEEEEEEGEQPIKSLLGDSTKRKRDESKEDKKARKSQLREEKRGRRQEKKEVKFMYKEERKQVINCLTARNAPMPGVSEFKI